MMSKNKIDNIVYFLSPFLILSYFIIHKIILVLIGIIMSLYLINIKKVESSVRYIISIFSIKKTNNIQFSKNKIDNNSNSEDNDKINSKLSLVETIEELGYIPSIEKKDISNAA